ncbi:VOC family protein [Variovorax sp. HJSM1_2]|uniref:VOC family protein n=1 Tax=Variovorax sp. HJSM1_2 TaxID=3366263 RepID=UPI003BC9DA77
MSALETVEIKAFVPARDFALAMRFYQELGFTKASEGHGVAYFYCGDCSFLLQPCEQAGFAEQFVMHLLVPDVKAWWQHVAQADLAARYQVKVGALTDQPWGMREFVLHDPSGVLWRIAQNLGPPVAHAADAAS